LGWQSKCSPRRLGLGRSVIIPPIPIAGIAMLCLVLTSPETFLRRNNNLANGYVGPAYPIRPIGSVVRWEDCKHPRNDFSAVHVVQVVVLILDLVGNDRRNGGFPGFNKALESTIDYPLRTTPCE
jgi:hypothetical protein